MPFNIFDMKKLLIFLLFFSHTAYSQEILTQKNSASFFNTNGDEAIFDVIYLNDYLYVPLGKKQVISPDTIKFPYQTICKFSKDLQLIDSITIYSDTSTTAVQIMKGLNNKLYQIQWTRGGINGVKPNFQLIRMDADLNIELIKTYEVAMDFFEKVKPYFSANEMLLSMHGRLDSLGDGIQKPWIWKLDEDCNRIKSYVIHYNNIIFSIHKVPNSNDYYLFCGLYSYLYHTDSLFNIKTVFYPDFSFHYTTQIHWQDNSSFFITSYDIDHSTTGTPVYDPTSKAVICKLDTGLSYENTETVFYGDIGLKEIALGTTSVLNENHGLFFATLFYNFPLSAYYFSADTNFIRLANYTTDLDFLWEKKFFQRDTTMIPTRLLDVGDGLILAGEKFCPYDPIPNLDAFLYKFDYEGNLLHTVTIPAEKSSVVLFPNPFNDYLQCKAETPYQTSTLKIHTAQGEVVKVVPIHAAEQSISTSSFSPGIYFWQLEDQNGRTQASGKLVKAIK